MVNLVLTHTGSTDYLRKTRKAVLDLEYTETIKRDLCDFWCVRIAAKIAAIGYH